MLNWIQRPTHLTDLTYLTQPLHFGFGFAETGDAVAILPLAAFLEQRRAFETFEDIALATQHGRRAQTAML